jgi:hypothetical protein
MVSPALALNVLLDRREILLRPRKISRLQILGQLLERLGNGIVNG